jgi:hypothetical protein
MKEPQHNTCTVLEYGDLTGCDSTSIFKSLATFHGALAASWTTLHMEAVRSSEASVTIYQLTKCHVPEDMKPHQRLEKLQNYALYGCYFNVWV